MAHGDRSAERKVFLFGQSGSGKSTICASIAHFFHECDGLVPDLNAVENPEGARLLRRWVKDLRRGIFPSRTNAGTFTELTIGFNVIGREEGLRLSFLEVAGEDVIMLDPLHEGHLRRSDLLDQWLGIADAIVLVASTDPLEDDRYILQAFCEYLAETGSQVPLCLLVSEWDRLAASGTIVLDYVKENYSEAARHVAACGGHLMSFSVGEVDLSTNRISSIHHTLGVKELVEWLMNE